MGPTSLGSQFWGIAPRTAPGSARHSRSEKYFFTGKASKKINWILFRRLQAAKFLPEGLLPPVLRRCFSAFPLGGKVPQRAHWGGRGGEAEDPFHRKPTAPKRREPSIGPLLFPCDKGHLSTQPKRRRLPFSEENGTDSTHFFAGSAGEKIPLSSQVCGPSGAVRAGNCKPQS